MCFTMSTFVVLIAAILCGSFVNINAEFNLHLVHYNDFHARFEETSVLGSTCKDNCIGGFSRLYTAVHQELKRRPNSIVLNAGDSFQGTLWYNLFKWNGTQHFLNKIPTHANAIGNHEFDDKVEGAIPFLKTLNAPTVAANIDDSEEPEFQNTYKKSIILERDGKRVGVIGVLLATTNQITSSGKLKFADESKSVNAEAERLVAEENVDTIIVLSHCGYPIDQKIAKLASPKIGVVVGAHTHSFLFTGNNPPGIDQPVGPYPTIVENKDGNKVLVVQALAFAKYLGNITVTYDDEGHVVSWSGAPIYLNEKIPQDEAVNNEIAVWKKEVDKLGKLHVGETRVLLTNRYCRTQECSLGNLLSDSMIYGFKNRTQENAWAYAAIAITNPGSIRTSIEIGNITYGDLVAVHPFENTYDVGDIQGKYLLEALEFSANRFFNQRVNVRLNFLQASGIRVVYNITKPIGSRVESVQVRCQLCSTPIFEKLDLNKIYRIIVNSFVARGGDGFTAISDNIMNLEIGPRDIDIFEDYVRYVSPIDDMLDGRIKVVT